MSGVGGTHPLPEQRPLPQEEGDDHTASRDDGRESGEETPFRRFVSEFAASRMALAGLVVFVLIALAAIFASLIAPQNPYDLAQLDIMDGRLPPGPRRAPATPTCSAPTTRAATCCRASCTACAFRSASVSVPRSSPASSAPRSACSPPTSGGRTDAAIMRLVDLQLSFPSILVALMILAVLGKGVMNVVLALVIVEWAYYTRTVRATALGGTATRIHRGRGMPRAAATPHHLPPPVSQLPAAADRHRHAADRARHRARGDAVVPRPRRADHRAVARPADRQRLPVHAVRASTGSASIRASRCWSPSSSINLVGDQLRDVLNPRLQAVTTATLEVRNLRTHFFTRAGVVKAVDDVSFSIARGQVLGLVGESGSGKTVTGFSIIGLVDPPGRIAGGSILYQGQDLAKLSEREMRALRGNRIAMIFQDPMMTLNPVLRIDTQMIEAVRAHAKVSHAEARAPRARCAWHGRHPEPRRTPERLSAPVLRRHAPARRHRHRAAAPSRPADRRRTDHGARRHHPGADPRRGAEARGDLRHRADLDHATICR